MTNTSNLFNVLCFNLKCDGFSLTGKNKWKNRIALVGRVIEQSGAAVVGVQELLPGMRQDLSTILDEYTFLGEGRYRGTKSKGDEHNDILLCSQLAGAQFNTTFWLSKKPDYISRAYYALFPRICTVAQVYLKDSGKQVRVFNTHLDHICGRARMLGIRVILNHMRQLSEQDPMPCILMGDFNCKANSKPVRYLRDHIQDFPNLHLTDVYTKFEKDQVFNTLHFFRGKIRLTSSPIDFCFVSDEIEVVRSRILTDPINGHYPSDHFPLLATLRLK